MDWAKLNRIIENVGAIIIIFLVVFLIYQIWVMASYKANEIDADMTGKCHIAPAIEGSCTIIEETPVNP